MKSIILCCAAGMSTSMLVRKMVNVVKERGLDVSVNAISLSDVKEYIETADIILLGPQVKYELEKLQSLAEPKGKKVLVIDMKAYGLMDGEAVLNKALSAMDA